MFYKGHSLLIILFVQVSLSGICTNFHVSDASLFFLFFYFFLFDPILIGSFRFILLNRELCVISFNILLNNENNFYRLRINKINKYSHKFLEEIIIFNGKVYLLLIKDNTERKTT